MTLLDAIILGLVEGITEYLPISSTGHLILTSILLGISQEGDTGRAVDSFNIVVQGGAILAVAGLYRSYVSQMTFGLIALTRRQKSTSQEIMGQKLFTKLLIAFLPAAILGPIINDPIEENLFAPIPIATALGMGGILMLFWKSFFGKLQKTARMNFTCYEKTKDDISSLTIQGAFLIGLFQCIAMWPGTSRSMMCIVGGVAIGLRPKSAAEFGFLLGLPTLGGACIYKLAKDQLSNEPGIFEMLGPLQVFVGIAVATISAGLAIKWLIGYLNKRGLEIFGWYRIVLAFFILLLWNTNY